MISLLIFVITGDFDRDLFYLSFVALLVVLGFTTSVYTEGGVPAFHALILISSITGKMRTVFPGINFKLPWENGQKEGEEKRYVDLRVDLREICEETYASKDAMMKTKYVYTIKPNISDDPPGEGSRNAGEKIIIFSSFEPSAIKSKGRALFSMLLSDYYGKNDGVDLLDKSKINKAVFGKEDEPQENVVEFEKKHAVIVTVRLEDSDFNDRAQRFRDMISGARSIDEARNILMADSEYKGQTIAGMSREAADKMIKLMNFEGDYKETDFNLNVHAPDLQNLRDVTVLGNPGSIATGKEKKGDVKK